MASHLDLLREQARALPRAPGVYFWKDEDGRILYIGKAVNLRARVMSYFSNAHRDRRTQQLLATARSVTAEVAESELEALLRESALIKREQPPRNRLLRRPRRLYYLKLDGAQEDPYLEVVRGEEDDGSLYFGPFPSAALARETMAFLHAVLPLRKCKAANPRCKPCLYFQMHTCAGPLIDSAHRARHREAMGRLRDMLDGRTDRVAEWLERKRDNLSDLLLFEQAGEVQARLEALADYRRNHAILEAAVQCRCVLIHDASRGEVEPRLMLVAHGKVVGMRRCENVGVNDIARWVAVHDPIIRTAQREQGDLDSASVVERWLRTYSGRVRWVALTDLNDQAELTDSVRYVLSAEASQPLEPLGVER